MSIMYPFSPIHSHSTVVGDPWNRPRQGWRKIVIVDGDDTSRGTCAWSKAAFSSSQAPSQVRGKITYSVQCGAKTSGLDENEFLDFCPFPL